MNPTVWGLAGILLWFFVGVVVSSRLENISVKMNFIKQFLMVYYAGIVFGIFVFGLVVCNLIIGVFLTQQFAVVSVVTPGIVVWWLLIGGLFFSVLLSESLIQKWLFVRSENIGGFSESVPWRVLVINSQLWAKYMWGTLFGNAHPYYFFYMDGETFCCFNVPRSWVVDVYTGLEVDSSENSSMCIGCMGLSKVCELPMLVQRVDRFNERRFADRGSICQDCLVEYINSNSVELEPDIQDQLLVQAI